VRRAYHGRPCDAHDISIRPHKLLLQITKSAAISHDVVFDIALQILNLGGTALEQGMKNDLLMTHTKRYKLMCVNGG
jgi:hypothetical protein